MKAVIYLLGIAVVTVVSACAPVPKTTIRILEPGEINIEGVHKIAILPFSTEKGWVRSYLGNENEFAALARRSLYRQLAISPHFTIIDLSQNKKLNYRYKPNSKEETGQLDGLITGRVWWRIAKNPNARSYPKIYTLSNARNIGYIIQTKLGPIRLSRRVTTQTEDRVAIQEYKTVRAELMINFTLYRISPKNGMVDIVTYSHELAVYDGVIDNGLVTLNRAALRIPDTLVADVTAYAEPSSSPSGNEAGLFDLTKLKSKLSNTIQRSKKSFSKERTAANQAGKTGDADSYLPDTTLPNTTQIQTELASRASASFVRRIEPTWREIGVNIRTVNPIVKTLLKTGAYLTAMDWQVNEVMLPGDREASRKFIKAVDDLGAQDNFVWPGGLGANILDTALAKIDIKNITLFSKDKPDGEQTENSGLTEKDPQSALGTVVTVVRRYLLGVKVRKADEKLKKLQATAIKDGKPYLKRLSGPAPRVTKEEAFDWLKGRGTEFFSLGIAAEAAGFDMTFSRGAYRLALIVDPGDYEAARGISRYEQTQFINKDTLADQKDLLQDAISKQGEIKE